MIALPPAAEAQGAPGGPSECEDKAGTYFQFTYNDGGIDSGCAEGNVVTRADNPGQLAPSLHVSCSEDFNEGGVPGRAEKSDLGITASGGERLVTSYLIIKDVTKSETEICGDTTSMPAGSPLGLLFAAVGAAGAFGVVAVWNHRSKPSSLAV